MMKPKVLIVEDDVEMCEELKGMLEDKGYLVDAVNDGAMAMRMAVKGGYAVVLLDLKIPGIHGRNILKSLKGEMPKVPVIVVTGSPSAYAEFDLADGVIHKPFSPEMILSSVKKLANSRKK